MARSSARPGKEASGAARRRRATIAILWGASFAACVCMACYLFFAEWIEEDTFRKLMTQVSTSYSVYVASIAAFYYSLRGARGESVRGTRAAYVVALCASLLYNLLLIAVLGRVVLLVAPVEGATELMGYVSSTLSWVVAPAVAYFFATGTEK